MTDQTTILYFGNDWNAENRTSSHHVARLLAERRQVIYVECPGMRAPRGSGRDVRKIFQKLWKGLRGTRTVLPRLKVKTLLQIPLHRFALVRWLNARLILWSVRWLMWRNGIRQPILWFVIPHVASLVGRLGESLSVYYCIDDYASLPDVNVEAVRAMDDLLTRKADLVFVASDTLLPEKLRLNPNTYHSPHGVDVAHFGQAATRSGEAPSDIAAIPRPIVGFFGLIESWIDLGLVAYLAEQRPQWSFLMIGRVAVPESAVPRLPNLHFLGRRPYEQLPDYGRYFDVGIIPYKLTQQVIHANPLKLREYLAMGKPTVSVSTPETEKFADIIDIARSRDEFLAKLDKAVQQPDSPEAVQRRLDRVAPMSWESRVAEVLNVVDAARARKAAMQCPAGAPANEPRLSADTANCSPDANGPRAKVILYFGNGWSSENMTSSHHIARGLAGRYEVHYVECPGLRAPGKSSRDFWRIFEKIGRFLQGGRRASSGLEVHTLLQIPLHRFALVRWLNVGLTRWAVRWLMWRHGIRKPIVWFTVPHVATLVGQLDESLSVYYCVDDYASLPKVEAATVRGMDDMLTAKADMVFAVSEKLLAAKSCKNRHTHYSPHGVDLANFGRAQDARLPVPDDIRHLAQPIIGFFGVMEGRFDLDLIAYLAKQRPHWNFLLIGHVGRQTDELPNLDNMHFVGKRPYDQLANYGRHFAAAIIPYKVSQQALYGNPIKLREYLAMGKPVVSIGSPEAEKFADVIEIAHSREEFLAKVDKVVGQPDSPEAIQKRLDRVAPMSWDARVSDVIGIVEASLAKKAKAPVDALTLTLSRRERGP